MPAATRLPDTTAPTRGGTFATLDARTAALARAHQDGTTNEQKTRWGIAEAVVSSNIVPFAVATWLRGNPHVQHLEADLVAEATDWVIYRLTGHATGAYMDPTRHTRELADLDRFATGAATVAGFVYTGVLRNMTKFLRTLRRHSTTHQHSHLTDTDILATVEDRLPHRPAVEHELHQGQARRILEWHSDTTLRASELKVIWANAEAVAAMYGVPTGARPIDRRQRKRMAAILRNDGLAAHRSLEALATDTDTDTDAEELTPVWAGYSRAQMDTLLTCPRPSQAAATICLGAVSNLPHLSRSDRATARRNLGAAVKGHPGQLLAYRVLDLFIEQEFGETSPRNQGAREPTWDTLASELATRYPDLIGGDVRTVRDTLMGCIPWDGATGAAASQAA